eukprot:m.263047 g.263047  ORF g.263047 m.263047 type:complete len:222 (-) comp48311_c0_seq1:175-840(-)
MSSINIRIRRFDSTKPGDVAQICKIYGYYVEHTTSNFELEPPTEEEMKNRLTALQGFNFPIFVAETRIEVTNNTASDSADNTDSATPSDSRSNVNIDINIARPKDNTPQSNPATDVWLVVGYAYVGKHKARDGYNQTVEDSIYLAKDMGRKGIGKALLTELIAECKRMGFKQMIAHVGDDSVNVGSIKLHRGAGFSLIGTAKNVGYKFGRYLDVTYLQLAL